MYIILSTKPFKCSNKNKKNVSVYLLTTEIACTFIITL